MKVAPYADAGFSARGSVNWARAARTRERSHAMHKPGDKTLEEAGLEESPPETRAQKLESLIEQKRGEETEARGRAAKLAAKLKGMPSEGGKSIDPHKSKSVLGTLAAVVLKGGLQAANDIQRESAERGLRDAEAAEEQARAHRRALEEELKRERCGAGGGADPPASDPHSGEEGTPPREATVEDGEREETAGLSREQHDYLLAACRAAEGKGGDEVIIGEGRITRPAGVEDRREAEMLLALREEGMLRYDFGTDKAFLTPAGSRYCDLHGNGSR